jgi:hypothetical protein
MSTLHYRQNIVAAIRIAGHQIGDVVSHGGNRAAGSHITACFGAQVMITLLDLDGALQFANAWLAPEHQWVFGHLPAELPSATAQDVISTGPSLTVLANGVDKISARYDPVSRAAHIRAGALTWIVQDQVAATSMIAAWRYVARIAPMVLSASQPSRRS